MPDTPPPTTATPQDATEAGTEVSPDTTEAPTKNGVLRRGTVAVLAVREDARAEAQRRREAREHAAQEKAAAKQARAQAKRQARQQRRTAPPAPAPAADFTGPNARFVSRIRVLSMLLLVVLVISATAVGFVLSYTGLWHWAGAHGYSGWKQDAWPLLIDVFIAAGEIALFLLALDGIRMRGRKLIAADVILYGLLVGGGWVASLVFNILHVKGGTGYHVTAAFPPLMAMLGLFFLLRTVHRYTSGDHASLMAARTSTSATAVPSENAPQRTEDREITAEHLRALTEITQASSESGGPDDDGDGPRGGGAPAPRDTERPPSMNKKALVLAGLDRHNGDTTTVVNDLREQGVSVAEGYAHQVRRQEWLPRVVRELLASHGEPGKVSSELAARGINARPHKVKEIVAEWRKEQKSSRHLRAVGEQ